MTLYQSGLAQDVLLNIYPMGVTENGMFRVPFGSTLNFKDSIISFVCGRVKLLEHSIRGLVGATFAYSNSGQDVDAEDEAEALAAGACVLVPEYTRKPEKRKTDLESSLITLPKSTKRVTIAEEPKTPAMEEEEEFFDFDAISLTPVPMDQLPPELLNPAPSTSASSGRRFTRTTTKTVCGAGGTIGAGLTLLARLRIINTTLNKDYKREGKKTGYGKISNWPVTVVLTTDGVIRSRWSRFAVFACDDINFFRQLGYEDSQINTFYHDGADVYSLGRLPVEEGDVVARHAPDMDAISIAKHSFYLIPRRSDLILRMDAYANDVKATPSGLKQLFDDMLANANYTYRTSLLEQVYQEKYIWPDTGVYNHVPGLAGGVAFLHPANIFPIQAEYTGTGIDLEINTVRDIGSIRKLEFDERNPFGLPQNNYAWDDAKRRHKNVLLKSEGELGVTDQECEISSTMLYQGRGTLTGTDSVQAATCAIFMNPMAAFPAPLTTYFPKNRLASSVSYGHVDYICKSKYTHPTLTVVGEKFQYSLIIEIRNISD